MQSVVTGNSSGVIATLRQKPVVYWTLYDWANSAFATTIMAGFFPIFFKQYWSAGAEASVSTFRLGMANSLASFVLALLAPLLGAIADRGNARIRFLLGFTVLGVVASAGLYWVQQGAWQWAVVMYVMASMGFWGGLIFYDSLLLDVAERDNYDLVSGFGYGMGYLGGGLLFAVNVWMTLQPATFGLADATMAVKVSFLTVAVWWSLFALPLLFGVPEKSAAQSLPFKQALLAGFSELSKTFHEIRRYRALLLFLLAYWLYIDGVNTVIKMAVDYGLALGFPTTSLIVALLIVQFVGFPAAIVFGWLGNRYSTLGGIFIGIAVYIGVTIYAVFMDDVTEFYYMAIAIGLVQGGVQSLSRSYFGSLVPKDRAGEFFGFYNMMGKFASVLGPALMGTTALFVGSRYSILSLVVLFITGSALLLVAHNAVSRSE
ncbi:MAG: MFS transporter [Steroidobacteraceae bacterium]